jgi:hypothetical protein
MEECWGDEGFVCALSHPLRGYSPEITGTRKHLVDLERSSLLSREKKTCEQ